MKQYLLALDEGTTSARSILFDRECRMVSVAQQEFRQYFPKPGWVEQDPLEIYAAQLATMTECVAKSGIAPSEIAAIGITNQRETTVVWDRRTGRPICNAIVWQCRRTADICRKLEADGWSDYVEEATGLRPDAYFSATKLRWILDHVDGAAEAAARGDLLFGTVDTWLLWKLTDGKVHATDVTNASRTMLFHIENGTWDSKLLEMLSIPESMLPRVCSSSEFFGTVSLLGAEIPICGIAGDQQAALFGQCCFEPGEAKTTYGTGCFLLANTGTQRIHSKSGLITTLAANRKGEPLTYALEGSVFIGGAVIQWIRDELGLISESADCEYFARKVKDSGGVYLVPAFAGLGAPYWDMNARGIMTGLTRGTTRNHVIRAALESIAYQTEDVIAAMQKDMPGGIRSLKVDGGASANGFLMQFQADLASLPVLRPEMKEATAAGAAFLAGLSVGFFRDEAELREIVRSGDRFDPKMKDEERAACLEGWRRAIASCRSV